MTPEERSSANNGIWMCRDHGNAIDSPDPEYTTERLREWKKLAEQDALRRVLRKEGLPTPQPTDTELQAKIDSAARADLAIFQRTAKWPASNVALRLEVESFGEPVTTEALARAALNLDDLILVAPPGMGKTSTIFQIAEQMLMSSVGIPLVIPLGDWATGGLTLLDSILKRPAFQTISETEFRRAASNSGIVLLLDGWNELDDHARKRARVQVETLKAELPELALVVSTRKQILDIPFRGTRIDLLPLSEDQQMQIALAMRGDVGAKSLDRAWRTAGVRELVTVPLYLTTLLSLSDDALFPTTKEEVLRSFVDVHEKDVRHGQALYEVVGSFQRNYLGDLAVVATGAATSAIADQDALRSVFDTGIGLTHRRQIVTQPEPRSVLEALINNHLLMRAGEAGAVSFQHQQFQEWYASHSVEHRIIAEVRDAKTRGKLKAEVVDARVWEEPVLFAVERLARGNPDQRIACGEFIIAAFDVDPIFAAEMIFRATDEVWAQISGEIVPVVTRWHTPGIVDRALRFMLTSGRAEFLDAVWPLIAGESEQNSLHALRNCRHFRPSILGNNPSTRIMALSQRPRMVLLHEIALRGGVEGLDLASEVASRDSDSKVKLSIVDALAFRRADRHVALVLRDADDEVFDLVARQQLIREIGDIEVQHRINAARERQLALSLSENERLRMVVYASDDQDRSEELIQIVATMDIGSGRDATSQLIYAARNRYPRAVAAGLLARVRAGSSLFYGADDILAAAGFAIEEDAVTAIALTVSSMRDDQGEAAASVLGPKAVGKLIDALFEIGERTRGTDGRYDQAVADRYHNIIARIAHVPGASLVKAVQTRSAQADFRQLALMAELLSRHPRDDEERGRPFDSGSLDGIRSLVEVWGQRMLQSDDVERWQMARIATLASHAPAASLLPILKRLLERNLELLRGYRIQAVAANWRQGKAVNEARQPMTHEYQRAFLAITGAETASLMQSYLADVDFGELAARVLAQQWIGENEPAQDRRHSGRKDFRGVREKRATLAARPPEHSSEAEAIFANIEQLLAQGASEEHEKHAVALGIVASRLPHAKHRDAVVKLISLAARRSRHALLTSLILSGEVISGDLVIAGLVETFEAAKTESWILTQGDGYEWRDWLELLPYTDRPEASLDAVKLVPELYRQPAYFKELIAGLSETPSAGAEAALFTLAEQDTRFYSNYEWHAAAFSIGTESAAIQLLNLAASGVFEHRGVDRWRLSRQFAFLIGEFAQARRHAYYLISGKAAVRDIGLIMSAISENPDDESILTFVKIDSTTTRGLLHSRTVENVVTEHVADENWSGVYSVVPITKPELRRKLFAMVTDGGLGDTAAQCLKIIDMVRDEYGAPTAEPGHPDITSGKPWPIIQSSK